MAKLIGQGCNSTGTHQLSFSSQQKTNVYTLFQTVQPFASNRCVCGIMTKTIVLVSVHGKSSFAVFLSEEGCLTRLRFER